LAAYRLPNLLCAFPSAQTQGAQEPTARARVWLGAPDACPRRHPFISGARDLAATAIAQLRAQLLRARLLSGGAMLFKVAVVLLMVWLLGVVGAYRVGDLVHVLLLVGLLLLLLAFLRAREAAARRASGGPPDKP
jgi:hypothetical protein